MGRVCAFVLLAGLALSSVAGLCEAGPGSQTPATEAAAAPEGAAPAPLPEQSRTLALVGGQIRTQTDAGDIVGTIVIRDGKIAAIGPDVAVPADARRIDVSGHVVTPGLMDARSSLGLHPSSARENGATGVLNVLDAVDPFADDWRDAAAQGVTAVAVQPGGLFGGAGAILRVGNASTAGELVVRMPAAVETSLTAPPPAPVVDPLANLFQGRGGRGRGAIQAPRPASAPADNQNALTRYARYEQLRGLLDGGKKYGESKPAKKDPAKELLLSALKKELPLRLEVSHEDELRHALKLSTDFGTRTVLERVDKVSTLPDELRTSGTALVLGPFYQTAERPTAPTGRAPAAQRGRGAGRGNAAPTIAKAATPTKTASVAAPADDLRTLALDGRRWAIGTFGDEPRATIELRLHAAAAVADGYPRDRVLHALTRGAAELFGVADKLGAIAVGRPADLAVFAGDPLDPSVPVRIAISQGSITHDASTAVDRGEKSVASRIADEPSNGEERTLPDRLPPRYIVKTSRLLNPAGEYVPGELFIENGKVSPVPSTSAGRSDVPVYNLDDSPVTPGLVAAHHALSGEDSADADAGHLRAADELSPDDPALRALRDQGFLTVLVAPGPGNVVAGQAAVVRPGSGKSTGPDVATKFVLTGAARDSDRYPFSLVGQIELIGARLRGEPAQTDLYLPAPVRASLFAQRSRALEAVRSRKQTALFEAQTRAEIRAALRLIGEHNLRGVIVGAKGGDELTSEIRQARVGVVAEPIRPHDSERVRRGFAELGKAGVPVAFGSGNAAEMRATAAWLVQTGLSRPAARRGLTAEAALTLGLPAGAGRLSPGDAADFVVWDGCPLDVGSRPLAVVADGQRVRRGA
jgi:imidazolonepropionase-like amidohydrolase